MSELDYKESWVPKNWCFWTVELEKTLESPLDCKEIQPAHPKGNQSWIFIGSTDAEAETPVLWPPHAKSWLIWKDPDAGKDWRCEEKGTTEDEMAGLHHRLNGHESEWTPCIGDGQGGLACCSPWGPRVRRNWVTELNWTEYPKILWSAGDPGVNIWQLCCPSPRDSTLIVLSDTPHPLPPCLFLGPFLGSTPCPLSSTLACSLAPQLALPHFSALCPGQSIGPQALWAWLCSGIPLGLIGSLELSKVPSLPSFCAGINISCTWVSYTDPPLSHLQ